MNQAFVALSVLTYLVVWSPVRAADESNPDSSRQDIVEMKRMITELNERVERLEARLAAESQTAAAPSAADDDLIWQRFGVRLEEVPSDAFPCVQCPFRGGMKVVSVLADGPAARNGVLKGDILVGLHNHEVLNADHVHYILKNCDISQTRAVRCFLVRDGDLLHTALEAPPR